MEREDRETSPTVNKVTTPDHKLDAPDPEPATIRLAPVPNVGSLGLSKSHWTHACAGDG